MNNPYRNPWLKPNGFGGLSGHSVAEDRIGAVKLMTAAELRKVQGYTDNQKTVEQAIAVRLRKLAKGTA